MEKTEERKNNVIRYRLITKNLGGRGIAWHIRGITEGRFYGEIRFDRPEEKTFNCKLVSCTFQKDHWNQVVTLIRRLEKENKAFDPQIRYWSTLLRTDGKTHEMIAAYSPGDEEKTEAGKIYKQMLLILEEYIKPFYPLIVPNGEKV